MFKPGHKYFYRIALILSFPSLVFAQSAEVATHNESAYACYEAATSVATIEDFEINSNMFEPCNVALVELGLSDNDRAATFVNRGILHAASGFLAEALADYDEALKLYPTLGQVYINRGFVYHFENQLDAALTDYNYALELDIKNKHLVHFARGIVYEEKNLLDEALDDYRKALEYSPDWMPAKTRLQRVLGRMGQGAEVEVEVETYAVVYNK
jgi:tetratricopeptide (TPR) repeat protein